MEGKNQESRVDFTCFYVKTGVSICSVVRILPIFVPMKRVRGMGMVVLAAMVSPVFGAGDDSGAESAVRVRSEQSNPHRAWQLIEADVLEMEFELKPTQHSRPDLTTTSESLRQNMMLRQSYRPADGWRVGHDVSMGISASRDVHAWDANLSDADQVDQRHNTHLTYQAAPPLLLRLANEYSQMMVPWSEHPNEAVRQTASAQWRPMNGTTLTPEIWRERRNDHANITSHRNGGALAVNRRIYRQYVSLTLRPSWTDIDYDTTDTVDQQLTRVDGALQLRPVRDVRMDVGGSRQEFLRMGDDAVDISHTVFAQFSHQAGEDLSWRMRGDYEWSDHRHETNPDWDYERSRIRLSAGPQMRLNEQFSAVAEYRYLVDQHNGQAVRPEEQVLTVSVRGVF